MSYRYLNRAGDTIVEVMIAIIVLGAALGTSIAIATKSQRQTQANHEFYQAQLFANQQAEYILSAYNDYLAANSSVSINTSRTAFLNQHSDSTAFCYNTPSSKVDVSEATCKKTDGADFNISVIKSQYGAPPSTPTFIITVSWDSLTGSAQDQVELVYAI